MFKGIAVWLVWMVAIFLSVPVLVVVVFFRKAAKSNFLYRMFTARKTKKAQKEILLRLALRVRETFGVELDTIQNNIDAQNEIVRIVNQLAGFAAKACTEQDKAHRGEEVGTPKSCFGDRISDVSWDEAVHTMKVAWSEARKLANEVAPQLLERMPYFSEFEPLKEYNLHRPIRPQPLKWPTDKDKK